MPRCDMCGANTQLFLASVEGTDLNVCEACGKFGNIIRKIEPEQIVKQNTVIEQQPEEDETTVMITEGYGNLIKKARERLDLKQEDFAKKINEKTSLIHNIESEHKEPSIKTAEKIEKFLKIKLVEEVKLEKANLEHTESGSITIGDLIKLKK